MYKKILVPLDGSALAERAIWHAEEIARGADAEILLLQAVFVPMPVVPESALLTEGKVLEEVARSAAEYLDRVASELRSKGRNVRTVINERPPADAILHIAEQEKADLIVHEGDLHKLIKGSVAEKVLHGTKRPVLLVKP